MLSNYSSMEAAKSADQLTPVLTKSPSKATGMFSGTQDKCATCGKTAYPLEKTGEDGGIFVSCRTTFGLKPIQESKEHIIFHCYVFTMLDVAFFHRN
ncbi:hypothetical protein ACET3Z_011386 [Daucus carota]